MKPFHFSVFSLFVYSFLVFLGGCTVKKADSEITMPEQELPEQELSLEDIEMNFNYNMLFVYYLDAPKKLKEKKFYLGQGESAGYSPDNYEFPDIYNMFSQMGDEYTYYVGPYYANIHSYSNTSNQNLDIGIQVEMISSECTHTDATNENECSDSNPIKWHITQVYENAPSSQAGLAVGDTILLVGATNPRDENAFKKITSGANGDSISLKILRGDSILNVSVPLFCYLSPTVFLSYQDSIPIIKITEFAEHTAKACNDVSDSFHGTTLEFEKILKSTKGPVVIDLRGNPGGDMTQCIGSAKETLSKGDKLFTIKGTDYSSDSTQQAIAYEDLIANKDGAGKGRYYVLMEDSNTASCAEMMILAMTSSLKSPIVGTISYGKGIGQYYIDTPAGGYSIITSMKVLDENGDSYHDLGFIPDYDISDSLKALSKAVTLAKEGKAKRTHGYGEQRLNHFSNIFAKKANHIHQIPKGGAYKIIKNPLKKL